MAQRCSCCSTVLATTRAIWPHRMIALHRCQRQPNTQRPIPVRLNNNTGMLQKRILVRRGVARRGTRAPSALRRRRAVSLHAPGPPRHMLKVRKQMGFGRQSTLSDQLLLLGLRQLVGAARSNKQQEKTQSHWPGHRRIPRQVPHAIQVFPEEFVPNGDVLFHLPHLRQSLLPVLCHKPRAKNRCAATVWFASQETPAEPAPHCPTPQDWPSAPRTAQENNDGRNNSTHLPHHQLLPLRVLTQTIPTGLRIQVILQQHQVIKQTLTCALVHQRHHHDTAPINDDPHRVAAAVGAPNSNPARRGIAWQALKKVPASPWQMLPLFWWRMTGIPLFMA
ncbi:hypothetical protein TCDM_09180 [Trypanosoma cruzi Dm28c]|uniref:Uncharacterized protein n=1 Tax=Trypanosoma cruzi Dm28c TaxID=1416333 RepID=V5BAL1_TRYCR|nr:hypothetical protein TCDM_09180 [Trypanosoma cruzi Dm28c]